jgi:hypothetical protein
VLPENAEFPWYTAVMDFVPTLKVDVAKVATPPANVAVPRVALPFLNVILPAAVPLNSGTTDAVKVTDCPKAEGLCDEARVTVLVAVSTT